MIKKTSYKLKKIKKNKKVLKCQVRRLGAIWRHNTQIPQFHYRTRKSPSSSPACRFFLFYVPATALPPGWPHRLATAPSSSFISFYLEYEKWNPNFIIFFRIYAALLSRWCPALANRIAPPSPSPLPPQHRSAAASTTIRCRSRWRATVLCPLLCISCSRPDRNLTQQRRHLAELHIAIAEALLPLSAGTAVLKKKNSSIPYFFLLIFGFI